MNKKFTDYLRSVDESTLAGDIANVDSKLETKIIRRKKPQKGLVSEDSMTNSIVSLFNKHGIKIKLINPSPFGLQIDFFKKPNKDIVNDMLTTLEINPSRVKYKNLSIFIEL